MAFVCQSAQHFQAIQDCRNGSDGMPEGEERVEKKQLHFMMQSLLTAIAVREVDTSKHSSPITSRLKSESI
jgi:hypothetical protein